MQMLAILADTILSAEGQQNDTRVTRLVMLKITQVIQGIKVNSGNCKHHCRKEFCRGTCLGVLDKDSSRYKLTSIVHRTGATGHWYEPPEKASPCHDAPRRDTHRACYSVAGAVGIGLGQ